MEPRGHNRLLFFCLVASIVLHIFLLLGGAQIAKLAPPPKWKPLNLGLAPIFGKIERPKVLPKPVAEVAKKPETPAIAKVEERTIEPIPKTVQKTPKPKILPKPVEPPIEFKKTALPEPVETPGIVGGGKPGGGSGAREPGGGAAEVLTTPSPSGGPGGFVVGGIPKPEPGAKGPGLGGSGTAPGVGGSGSEPGVAGGGKPGDVGIGGAGIPEQLKPPSPPPPPVTKPQPKPPEKPTTEPPKPTVKEKPQIDLNEIARFKSLIYDKIEGAKEYPQLARLGGIEGKVKLSFAIKRNGYPENIKIIESSGHQILDDAATKVVNKAAPYLPFPKSVETPAIQVSVSIVYKLR